MSKIDEQFLDDVYKYISGYNIEQFKKLIDSLEYENISNVFFELMEKLGEDVFFNFSAIYTEEHPILYFIEKGLDVNVKIKNRVSLLQLSAAYSNFILSRKLIEKGANIHSEEYEIDALYSACIESENIDIVELLLKNNANPNKQYIQNQRYSILHILVLKISRSSNYFDGGLISKIISLLLNYGADPYLKDATSKTSIDVCRDIDREYYKKLISVSEEIRRFYICEN